MVAEKVELRETASGPFMPLSRLSHLGQKSIEMLLSASWALMGGLRMFTGGLHRYMRWSDGTNGGTTDTAGRVGSHTMSVTSGNRCYT